MDVLLREDWFNFETGVVFFLLLTDLFGEADAGVEDEIGGALIFRFTMVLNVIIKLLHYKKNCQLFYKDDNENLLYILPI